MSDTAFFPYPHVFRGKQKSGSIRSWPRVCIRCSARPCEEARAGGLKLCSYGINYWRVDANFLVAGVVVHDYQPTTPARRKRLRESGREAISRRELEEAVSRYESTEASAAEAIAREKAELMREYVREEGHKRDFLEPLREEIARGLSFVHDYRQINAQIRQNINVVLEKRYPEGDLEKKLAKALPSEKAIYECAKFLEEKLNVARFLLDPAWLVRSEDCAKFRVHGMITKYVRIYQSQYDQKQVVLEVGGRSYGEVIADPQACGVIPHTLLDNALKYSRRGSRVVVFVRDDPDGVYLSVTSYGPEIRHDEREKIFDPFYRGEAAKDLSPEGAGYGLYVAQLIAKEHLGSEIRFEQSNTRRSGQGYRTVFDLVFPVKAKILY